MNRKFAFAQQAQNIFSRVRHHFNALKPNTSGGAFHRVNDAKDVIHGISLGLAFFQRDQLAIKTIQPLKTLHEHVFDELLLNDLLLGIVVHTCASCGEGSTFATIAKS